MLTWITRLWKFWNWKLKWILQLWKKWDEYFLFFWELNAHEHDNRKIKRKLKYAATQTWNLSNTWVRRGRRMRDQWRQLDSRAINFLKKAVDTAAQLIQITNRWSRVVRRRSSSGRRSRTTWKPRRLRVSGTNCIKNDSSLIHWNFGAGFTY